MIDFVVKENGMMDVLLPGAVLRGVECLATLEDQGLSLIHIYCPARKANAHFSRFFRKRAAIPLLHAREPHRKEAISFFASAFREGAFLRKAAVPAPTPPGVSFPGNPENQRIREL